MFKFDHKKASYLRNSLDTVNIKPTTNNLTTGKLNSKELNDNLKLTYPKYKSIFKLKDKGVKVINNELNRANIEWDLGDLYSIDFAENQKQDKIKRKIMKTNISSEKL